MNIKTLINQKENTKIDFEREWYWCDKTPKDQLDMALAYQESGNDIKAFEYHHKSLDMRKKLLNENHYEIGVSYANLSGFYLKFKKRKEAYAYISEAVVI